MPIKKGNIPWNKGMRGTLKHSDITRKFLGNILIETGKKTRFKKGMPPWNKSMTWPEISGKNHPMSGKHHSLEARRKISEANLRRNPMTVEQRVRWGKLHSGEKNGKWKGDVSIHESALRKTIEYRDWRKAVFERDKFHCRVCGSNGYMNAHHIRSFRDHLELRHEISNGITVCIECHAVMHKREYLFIEYLQGILENGLNSAELSQKETMPSQQERLRKALWACVTVSSE